MKKISDKNFHAIGKQIAIVILVFFTVLESGHAREGIVDATIEQNEADRNVDVLQSKMSGVGILFCSGKKGEEIVECRTGGIRGAKVKTDLYRIAASGWLLRQVFPDEQNGNWYFFFQR